MIKIKYFALAFFVFFMLAGYAQETNQDSLELKLRNLALSEPALNTKVSVSVEDLDMGNFLRAVANNAKININIDPKLNINVTNNFSDVKVVDLLIFVCREYNLEIDIIGNIISVYMADIPAPPPAVYKPKQIPVTYNKENDLISFDIKNDTLEQVIKEITLQTGKNIVVSPDVKNKVVSGYVQGETLDKAITMLAFANNFIYKKDETNGFYLVRLPDPEQDASRASSEINNISGRKENRNNKNQDANKKTEGGSLFYEDAGNGIFSIYCEKANLEDIIKSLCDTLHLNYFITTGLTAEISLNLVNADFETFLQHVFSGLKFSYIKKDGIYLFGDTQIQELRVIKNIQLQYRSVEDVEKIIPSDLKKELEIKEFLDLNSLLVSGAISKVNLVENFLRDIDKLVPVVLIEVIVVDISKSANISTGISVGTTVQEVQSGGTVFPGIDYTLSSGSINTLLNSFDGFGTLNLGRVNSNFYMSLKALESNGNIKIRSTPQLATLNGHEANLTIGKTTYYKEQTQNLAINQSTTSVTTVSFKAVKADLSIKIKPVVSGDEQITLEVEVKQSDFGARSDPDAPPDQVSREFKSTIRVKNQEMVLLGGLEEMSDSKTSSGLPLLARVPVLKWLFSSRVNESENSKLNIFIKPTVIN